MNSSALVSLFWIIFSLPVASQSDCKNTSLWRNNPPNTCCLKHNTSIWRPPGRLVIFPLCVWVYSSVVPLFVYGHRSAVTLCSEPGARRRLSVTPSQHNIHHGTAAGVTGTPLTASGVVRLAARTASGVAYRARDLNRHRLGVRNGRVSCNKICFLCWLDQRRRPGSLGAVWSTSRIRILFCIFRDVLYDGVYTYQIQTISSRSESEPSPPLMHHLGAPYCGDGLIQRCVSILHPIIPTRLWAFSIRESQRHDE